MSTTVPWSHLGLKGYDCEEIVVDGWRYFDEGDGGGPFFTVKEDWYDSIHPETGSMLFAPNLECQRSYMRRWEEWCQELEESLKKAGIDGNVNVDVD